MGNYDISPKVCYLKNNNAPPPSWVLAGIKKQAGLLIFKGGVAELVKRLVSTPNVSGSNHSISTKLFNNLDQIISSVHSP